MALAPLVRPFGRGAFALVVAAIVVLTLAPGVEVPDYAGRLTDKADHCLAYALATLFGWIATARRRLLLLGLAGLGALLEVGQAVTALGRHGEVADGLANLLGVLLGAGLARLLEAQHRRLRGQAGGVTVPPGHEARREGAGGRGGRPPSLP